MADILTRTPLPPKARTRHLTSTEMTAIREMGFTCFATCLVYGNGRISTGQGRMHPGVRLKFMGEKPKKVYFAWMGAYWSCTPEVWAEVQDRADAGTDFDLYRMGCHELRARPKGRHRPTARHCASRFRMTLTLQFAEVPSWTYAGAQPGVATFFAARRLAGLENKTLRLRADVQRALLGYPVFGKRAIWVDGQTNAVSCTVSVCFGTDFESATYAAHIVAAAAAAEEVLWPGVDCAKCYRHAEGQP